MRPVWGTRPAAATHLRPAVGGIPQTRLVGLFTTVTPAQAADLPFTYNDVGATAGELPDGYGHLRRQALLGSVPLGFEHAVDALLSWQMHRDAGLSVVASDATVRAGGTVILGIARLMHAPCRVVYLVDEPDRQGFAYGTLPGHPESGEEAFVVAREAERSATFTVTAFSRPAGLLARLAGPVGTRIQQHVTDRYVTALHQAAA
jgi:uncharacterized protein (UPF0548 family)